MTITTAQLVAQFGAYYLANRGNMKRLFQMLFYPSLTDQLFTTIPIDDTRYEMAQTIVTRILQPFQKAFTPLGNLDFKPLTADLFRLKVDLLITPDDLQKTYAGFLMGKNDQFVKDWPFVRWLMETHLMKQWKQDYELNEVFGGVFAAPTAGTPGAAGTAMNGVKKVINDLAGAGRIAPILMGAMPSDGEAMVEYVDEFCGQVDRRYRGVPMRIGMDRDHAELYAAGIEKKFGRNTDGNQTNDGTKVSRRPHRIHTLDSTMGSQKIWMTPDENAIRLIKGVEELPFLMEGQDRSVKLWGDIWRAVAFPIPEAVFTNDRDMS